MARCHVDVGIQWSFPRGGSHCLGHGVPAVVVDAGALWRYLGFSQSLQRTKETSQTTSRSRAVHEYCLSLACLLIPRRICWAIPTLDSVASGHLVAREQHSSPWRINTATGLRGVWPSRGQRATLDSVADKYRHATPWRLATSSPERM